MAISIKNSETDRLAHELARATGENITTAITIAIRERLEAVTREGGRPDLLADVEALQRYVATLPDRDPRTPDEIIGYDDFGLPV